MVGWDSCPALPFRIFSIGPSARPLANLIQHFGLSFLPLPGSLSPYPGWASRGLPFTPSITRALSHPTEQVQGKEREEEATVSPARA